MPYEDGYKEWLERSLIEMNPDWICDGMSDIDITHTWCEKNCGTDNAYIMPKCLHMYYHHIVRAEQTEPKTDCFLCKWLGEVDVCGRCRNRNLFAEADTEPQQVVRLKHFKCPKCGRSDYIRSFEDWGIDGGIYKYKCINCNTYIKDDPNCSEKPNNCEDEPTGYNLTPVEDEPQTDCPWR